MNSSLGDGRACHEKTPTLYWIGAVLRAGNDAIPDPSFQRWRGRQYDEAEDVRRLVRRS